MHTPPFAVRGAIEAFYGPPWAHEQRLDLIDFSAAHGMNTFVHTPKDAPRLRAPYAEEGLRRLGAHTCAGGHHRARRGHRTGRGWRAGPSHRGRRTR